RLVNAARGRGVVEFGTRRAHGAEAGLFAARAAYIGGCVGTSNVEAGHLFGIPTFGTLAHSFVMSFEDEDHAFRAFLKVFPETATILVDTYDTIAAVKRLARSFGKSIPAIRLDSGDLCGLSKQARLILDDAGMTDTRIFASGDLNEDRIADLIARGAQIDSFGAGTELATSYDAPALSGVYKLAALLQDGRLSMRIKLSHDKATYPGPKQVWRFSDKTGKYSHDVIALADEEPPNSTSADGCRPLCRPVMMQGQIVGGDFAGASGKLQSEKTTGDQKDKFAGLKRARDRASEEVKHLPEDLLALDSEATYPVSFSARLSDERDRMEHQIAAKHR
ncbi:MAG: nicotinate phosphoribosyltransferase, partial [Blastocatellia bacterium]